MKNRYSFRSRISEAKTRDIARCFSVDLTALQTAELTGANRNTINRVYLGLRQRRLIACEKARPMFGDLLDLIRACSGLSDLRGAMEEARRFLSLPTPEPRPKAGFRSLQWFCNKPHLKGDRL